MLKCQEAARLISDSLDRPLSLRERLGLRTHLLMCRMCARCREQMLFLRKAMNRLCDSADTGRTQSN
ncbi:MAG: zf-HC2 domain-containing protein [Planctomycetota bacterium]|nr:zf-HC2 domain-containing protein [Planctomycetota bacterium]